MQKRHTDPLRYFNEQALSTEKHIIPFINSVREILPSDNVLEIGCGEAGNLKPFLDKGCNCVGVDFNQSKIEKGRSFYSIHPNVEKINLISNNIYESNEFHAHFDIVIIRDVIEHIHDQDKFLGMLGSFIKQNAIVFVAFPPWQSPFGGHQQICSNKLLSALPYFHLFPTTIYKFILKVFGEDNAKIEGLLEIKETGISLERFERICYTNKYQIIKKIIYFINPNYEIKFGLKPRKLFRIFRAIPYFRDFVSTCGYYIIVKK